jgi:hypothetical protein
MSRLELIPNVFGGERCGSRGGIGLVPSCRKPSPIQAWAEHVRNRRRSPPPAPADIARKIGARGPTRKPPHKAWPPPIAGAVICTACIVHRSVVRQHVFASPRCSCVRRFAVNRDRERAVSLRRNFPVTPVSSDAGSAVPMNVSHLDWRSSTCTGSSIPKLPIAQGRAAERLASSRQPEGVLCEAPKFCRREEPFNQSLAQQPQRCARVPFSRQAVTFSCSSRRSQ